MSTADVRREVVDEGLAVAGRTGAPGNPDSSGAEAPAANAGLPEPTVVERSLAGRRRSQRAWLFGVCVCTVAAASLLPSEPALAALLAVPALVNLHRVRRVRRERRSAAALHRLAATARSGRPTTEGSA